LKTKIDNFMWNLLVMKTKTSFHIRELIGTPNQKIPNLVNFGVQ